MEFFGKLVAGSGANHHKRLGKKEGKWICSLYLGCRGLLASIFGEHGKRRVGDYLKKLWEGGRREIVTWDGGL